MRKGNRSSVTVPFFHLSYKGIKMYEPKNEDSGILWCALTNYLNALEKDIPVIEDAIKYNDAFKGLLDNHKRTIKRINEILEEL